jgi:RNA recognition motif-containing protein
VKFHNHSQAQAAIEALHQKKEFNGNCIFVQKHIYASQNQIMTGPSVQNIGDQMKKNYQANIFVKFVPKTTTEEEFKTQMSKAGKVLSFMLRDHVQTNRTTGEKYTNFKQGFVCYEDVNQAQRCIQMFDSMQPFGFGQKNLSVDFWQSRDDMKQHRDEQSNQKVMSMINMIQ